MSFIFDFKNYFVRDFNYTTPPDLSGVVDADITKAFSQALYSINPNIFEDNNILFINMSLLIDLRGSLNLIFVFIINKIGISFIVIFIINLLYYSYNIIKYFLFIVN